MFFESHQRFLDTSDTAATTQRLNLRHEAMIDANRDILAGARVLDLASHDGRWSFAALDAGARHVTGVEAREQLVENAKKNFAEYEVYPGKYEFVRGDLFETLERESFDVDVVMCFGFLYHTLRYPELFTSIRRIAPKYLLVDTKVTTHQQPVIRLLTNRTRNESNAAEDAYSVGGTALAGWPSVPALRLMLETYGFEVESLFDWATLLTRNPDARGIKDYADGQRVTVRSSLQASQKTAA